MSERPCVQCGGFPDEWGASCRIADDPCGRQAAALTRVRALRLGSAGVAFAMDKVKRRGDVGNNAAYFDSTVKDMLAAMEAGGSGRSEMPLEDRLAIYVRNAGWELAPTELAEELLASTADTAMVERLLAIANELRTGSEAA